MSRGFFNQGFAQGAVIVFLSVVMSCDRDSKKVAQDPEPKIIKRELLSKNGENDSLIVSLNEAGKVESLELILNGAPLVFPQSALIGLSEINFDNGVSYSRQRKSGELILSGKENVHKYFINRGVLTNSEHISSSKKPERRFYPQEILMTPSKDIPLPKLKESQAIHPKELLRHE